MIIANIKSYPPLLYKSFESELVSTLEFHKRMAGVGFISPCSLLRWCKNISFVFTVNFYYANETIHSKYIMQIQTDMEQQQS